jgi:SlyX protein
MEMLSGADASWTCWHNAVFERGPAVSQEDRFVDIEIKLAHQEDLVETLNQTIYQQGRRIDQLEAMVAKMAEHLRTLREAGQQPVNERPPHY